MKNVFYFYLKSEGTFWPTQYNNTGIKIITSFFFVHIYLFFLFLAALGLRCCTQASSSCGQWDLLFVAVRGLLIVVASLVAEHGL